MKNPFIYLCLIFGLFFLTACPSSDDEIDEQTNSEKPSTKENERKPFVGFWSVVGASKPHFAMLLFEDNKCLIGEGENYNTAGRYNVFHDVTNWGFYEWAYNTTTSILSITNNYQWFINMMTDDSWMGITVGSSKEVSYTAKRCTLISSNEDYGKFADNFNMLSAVLLGTWKNTDNSEDTFSIDYNGNLWFVHNGYKFPGPGNSGHFYIEEENILEDQSSDKIRIITRYPWGESGHNYIDIEIVHPYNFKNVYINIDVDYYQWSGSKVRGEERNIVSSRPWNRLVIKGKYVRVL